MEIQELIDNIKGKNNVGIITRILSIWNMFGILLFIPFLIMMYIIILPMYLIFEPKNTVISLSDYIKRKLSWINTQESTQQKTSKLTKEPNNQMEIKAFTLPFRLKEEPEYTPTIELKSNQRASSFIALVKKITIGYLKSMAEDDSDFVFACVSEPAFDDDQLTTDKIYIIGRFIHDYVWHTLSENTPISSNHRLMYSVKYTPALMQLTDNFHSDKSVKGVQIYVESLMDYYIDIVISDDEPITTNTQAKQEVPTTNRQPPRVEKENNHKKEKEKGGIWTIIGVGFMGLIILIGVLEDNSSNSPKETAATQEPDLAIQPLPNTGDTDNPNFYGNNPLTIKTQSGKNYWIKISNSVNDMAMASYFIRGGDTLNVTVPTGSYTIKYASGDSWYGTAYLFGKETQYAKADEIFEFNNNGYTIELIYQTNGNLHTKGLDANQF